MLLVTVKSLSTPPLQPLSLFIFLLFSSSKHKRQQLPSIACTYKLPVQAFSYYSCAYQAIVTTTYLLHRPFLCNHTVKPHNSQPLPCTTFLLHFLFLPHRTVRVCVSHPLPPLSLFIFHLFSFSSEYNVSNSLASYLLLAVRGTEIISPSLETTPGRQAVLQDDLNTYLRIHNLTVGQMVSLLSPQ